MHKVLKSSFGGVRLHSCDLCCELMADGKQASVLCVSGVWGEPAALVWRFCPS